MDEDPLQYKEVCDAFVDDLRPATKTELRLIEKLGNLDWRLERLVMMETALLNMAGGEHADEILGKWNKIDGIGFIVEAWKKSASVTHCHDLLRRYMATLQHQFNSTLANFLKIEAHRIARLLEPASQDPYQRPAFDSLDTATEPEPEPVQQRKEPENVTPIDIQTRTQHQTPSKNEPQNNGPLPQSSSA